MIITFGEAREYLAKYAGKAGKCASDPGVAIFVKNVIQELLHQGAKGNLAKWELFASNGTITLPPDLEVPLKVKLGKEVGSVFDKWYSFYDQNTLDDCFPWEEGIAEDPNTYYTIYDIPCPGARLLAVPFCKEACDAHLIIQGVDPNGRHIYTTHKGEKLTGEYLSIKKDCPSYTNLDFARITGVIKTETNQYVRLYWYDPNTGNKGLLAEYRPREQHPYYRRYRINALDCRKCYKVLVLGRVRIAEHYDDNDIIPITNWSNLRLKAQQFQAEDSKDLQHASYMIQRTAQSIDDENQYNRPTQAPIDFDAETSPNNLKNII